MVFSQVALLLDSLEQLSSRNAITEALAEWFKTLSEAEIVPACYLSLGRLAPLYQRIEFNLAEKMVVRGIGEAFGLEASQVWALYKQVGDLGGVAEELKTKNSKLKTGKEDEALTLLQVYDALLALAQDNGQGSQERKVQALAQLLRQLDALSVKYVVRIILGRLRLGFSDMTILDALSVMVQGSKLGRPELEEAYQVYPDVGQLALLVKQHGIKGIEQRVTVTMGVPVIPALAQRLKTAQEMVEKMGEVMVEPKYDGTRVQIHIKKTQNSKLKTQNLGDDRIQLSKIQDLAEGDWQVRTFTRNLDESSLMFPELVKALDQVKANEVILDGEAVGVHPQTGKLLPFQVTITRKRKHGIEQAAIDVPLKFFVYDILYLDGKVLIDQGLRQRRQVLEHVILPGSILELAPAIVTDEPEVIRQFHKQQLAQGLEGAMVKKIDAPYRPGRKGWSWVKFKELEDSQGKLADTLDCVVMGFFRGKGKRAQFGIGAFLVGVIGNSKLKTQNSKQDEGDIVTIAKIGTGLSDEQWKELRKRLEQEVALEQPKQYQVPKELAPDVWVEPKVVVEIAADEITKSPLHTAGVALRFPRLVKFRDDKAVAQATTLEEVNRIQALG